MTTATEPLSLADLEAFDLCAPAGAGERRFCCPLPACAGKPRDAAHRTLSVNVQTGAWHCFRCDARGVLREHWRPARERTRLQLRQAFALAPTPAATLPRERAAVTENQPETGETATRSRFDWHAAYDGAEPLAASAGARYLSGRGIPTPLAEACGVRFARAWYGRLAVLFPVCSRAGELLAISGRCLDDLKPPTLTAGPKRHGVFATPGALKARPLVITEAPIDALSLAAAGVPAIALCGTSGPAWLPGACAFRAVAVAFDGDAAGDVAAAKLSSALQALGATVERWRPTAGKDWNACLQRHGRAALAGALRPPARRFTPDTGAACPHGHTLLARGGLACTVCQDSRCVGCGAWLGRFDGAFCPGCRAGAAPLPLLAPVCPVAGDCAVCGVYASLDATGRCPTYTPERWSWGTGAATIAQNGDQDGATPAVARPARQQPSS